MRYIILIAVGLLPASPAWADANRRVIVAFETERDHAPPLSDYAPAVNATMPFDQHARSHVESVLSLPFRKVLHVGVPFA